MIAKEPLSTRQFVIITLVLSLFSFIPVINLFSGILLVVTLIAWILSNPQGFLSVVWRTFMALALIWSSLMIIDTYTTHPHDYLVFALSVCGIVRSIIKARRRQEWLME